MIKKFILYIFIFFTHINFSTGFSVDEIEVKFFDVGQGNCTVIKCPHQGPIFLLDSGSIQKPKASNNDNVGATIKNRNSFNQTVNLVRGYINSQNNTEIPLLQHINDFNRDIFVFTSHPDKDHYNKMPDILANLNMAPTKNITFYLGAENQENEYYPNPLGQGNEYQSKFQNLLNQHRPRVFLLTRNNNLPADLVFGQTRVKFLSAEGNNTNAASLVLKISYGNFSVILTGDAEGLTTDSIINRLAVNDVTADILQMCHHGTETHDSNNNGWIQAVNPKYAIFSAGLYGGNYLHPRSSIAERLVVLKNQGHLEKFANKTKGHRLTCGRGNITIVQDPGFKLLGNLQGHNEFKVLNTTYGAYKASCPERPIKCL